MASNATVDLSCPNGCVDLEVSGGHELRDDREYLEGVAVRDGDKECPVCGAELGGDADE